MSEIISILATIKEFEQSIEHETELTLYRSKYFLNDIAVRLERQLIKVQKEDSLPNPERIKNIISTQNKILMSIAGFEKLEAEINQLRNENMKLKQKIKILQP